MARQRITRKELLRQPDQFITRSARIIEWVEANATSILYGVGAAVLAVVLVGGWVLWRANLHSRAEVLLYEAVNVGGSVAGSEDRVQSNQMVDALQALVREYDHTPAAAQAYWYLGRLYFARADYVAALEAYQQARSRLSGDSRSALMSVLLSLNLAYAEEAKGACDLALQNFGSVLQASAATWLRGEAYLGIGRCHEQSDSPAKAADIYSQALSDAEVNELTRQVLEERLANVRQAGTFE